MKELKLEDYSKVQKYLDLADYEGANFNFITMMMWKHEYKIQYDIHDNFVVMLQTYKGVRFWAMPFTSPQYYQEALDFMRQYSHEHHFDFIIDCAIDSFIDEIRPHFKDEFIFQRTRESDDYIYDRAMLQSLSGKKMQKRRNHYNAFLKDNPDYEYKDLDLVDDFAVILNCLIRWESDKENMSDSMASEMKGILFLLSSRHLLDFKVGGIFINGQMEAFTIASKSRHSTLQIHVEKANKEIRGLYPAILKELLNRHFQDEQFVNREEDMGLENLRKSKQALHPIKMVKKYRITEKKLEITKAKEEDKEDIIALWRASFHDENEQSTHYYFENIYKANHTYLLKNNHQLISMMQIVPMEISYNHYQKTIYFILGVATKQVYEGQGCMKTLMHYVMNEYKDKDLYLQAYIPDIYRQFGFYASHYHQKIKIDKQQLDIPTITPTHNYTLLSQYYDLYVKDFDEYRIRDSQYWSQFLKRCQAYDSQILVFEDHGYLVYNENDNTIEISECIYLSSESILIMLNYFHQKSQDIILECDLNVSVKGETVPVITMMSHQLEADNFDKSKFINEIY